MGAEKNDARYDRDHGGKWIKSKLSKKVHELKEFVVTNEEHIKVVAKGKNWKAPGTDGIQNVKWRKFEPVQELWQDHIRN